MKKIYSRTLIFLFVTFLAVTSLNYSTGPGNGGLSVTGAPFGTPYGAGSYCSVCHSGGSFTPTVTLALYSGANLVTNYTPGATYTVRVTRSGIGIPAVGGFGFQMTCATTPGNINNNTWGTPPLGYANRSLSSRNYIEHIAKQNSGNTVINIPWTAPATNVGSLKFWVALNTVNGDGNTTGDQAVANTLTIPVNPLPITILYFTGKNDKTSNLLEWATTNEVNSGYFTLEKSMDGQNFNPIFQVNAISSSIDTKKYSYTDVNVTGSPYYRVKHISVSNEELYYKTIQIKSGNTPGAFHYVQGNNIMLQLSDMDAQKSTLRVFSMDGKKVSESHFNLAAGSNTISAEKPGTAGIYLVSLLSEFDEVIYTGKVLVE